ncbi:hypothetical protein CL629_01440 [bacterium]|nr:hypothetical protein [bacterium]|tara:strand:- start:1408 stop:3378 length:1971 start_codon:yes stop_codon:yes gene_type:complete
MKRPEFHFEDILLDKEAEEDFVGFPIAERIFRGFRVLVVLTVLFVGIQVFRIGVFQHSEYEGLALQNTENYRVLQAGRGIIVDRFGKVLAENKSAFQAYLVPREISDDANERDQMFLSLSEFFGIDTEVLREDVSRKEKYFDARVFLSRDVPQEDLVPAASFSFPGFYMEEGSQRFYGEPEIFSHILGYTALVDEEDLLANSNLTPYDEVGKSGLEAYYDESLRGMHGAEIYVRDSLGSVQESRVLRQPEQGYFLQTYIDKEFQEYFYNRMSKELRGLGRSVGVGIAMNPQNGEVLALFGVPGFDSSDLVEYLDDENRPLFNRAVSGLYSPGSTIKPLVALAALSEGVVTPQKNIFSAGFIEVPNPFDSEALPSVFRDWAQHGWVDVRSALARSSNVYFYEVGGGFEDQEGLGIRRLKKWWKKFKLDKETGIDLPAEALGFLPDPQWKDDVFGRMWRVGDTYNVSIGQGDLLVTPLGLLSYINAFANGGEFYRPRLMEKIYEESGGVFEESSPALAGDVGGDGQEFFEYVQEGLEDAVGKPYGTAYKLYDLPFQVAAKTGSAQIQNNSKTNAFFVGYGPIPPRNHELSESTNIQMDEDEMESDEVKPEIAILVLVEDALEGSLNAIPIAKDVFAWYYENRIQARNNTDLDADIRED